MIDRSVFEEVVGRAFAFLSESGFEKPEFGEEGGLMVAVFDGDDLRVRSVASEAEGSFWTSLERPSLGRTVALETFHALHLETPEYPIGDGLPWPSRASFERYVEDEAEILRLMLDRIVEDIGTFEEVGGRLA